MVEVEAARAPSRGPEERAGRSGWPMRPEMVEAEHPVDAQRLGPAGGGRAPCRPRRRNWGRVTPTFTPAPVGAGRPGHVVDSTRAFSSRRAIDMIRLWARILMKPGSGTFISTSRW